MQTKTDNYKYKKQLDDIKSGRKNVVEAAEEELKKKLTD